MRPVSFSNHNFEKQNLVTTTKGDFYKCSVCGASGYRAGLQAVIMLNQAQFKVAAKCTFKASEDTTPTVKLPKRVLLPTMKNIGIIEGVHDVVQCPSEYARFKNDVWVYSESRKEAVRVLPYEIIEKEF